MYLQPTGRVSEKDEGKTYQYAMYRLGQQAVNTCLIVNILFRFLILTVNKELFALHLMMSTQRDETCRVLVQDFYQCFMFNLRLQYYV